VAPRGKYSTLRSHGLGAFGTVTDDLNVGSPHKQYQKIQIKSNEIA